MTWHPATAIEPELLPGETIRWTGSPSILSVLWSEATTLLIGFVFAVLPTANMANGWTTWIRNGTEPKHGIFGLAVSIIFFLAGLGFAASGLLEVVGVRRTVYAVTNKRILIVKTFLWRRVLAINAASVNTLESRENSDGSGSITFRREVHENGEGKTTKTLDFLGTRDVRGAVREIERLRSG